ncbi:MAG: tetratricopeptide repeat protein [Cyanobacteria bacterium P01_A01_bin.37]
MRWTIIGLLSLILWCNGGVGGAIAETIAPSPSASVNVAPSVTPPPIAPISIRATPTSAPSPSTSSAVTQSTSPSISTPAIRSLSSAPAWTEADKRELDQLRLEDQIRRIVRDSLSRSPDVQDRIELEVDRAFERTTTILNVLLAILTGIPILVALFVWLLRRSVISQLVGEVRTQLEKEIYGELKTQKTSAIQEIEKNKAASVTQLSQIVKEAQAVLDELKIQIKIANDELDGLKSQAAFQIETMVSDAENVKAKTMQELASLLPHSTQDSISPELQPRIGRLTHVLDNLKSAIPQLTFTANDYIKQGNALFFESRYDDAIATYDKAIQLDPDLYEAWFGKASSLVVQQHYDDALDAYHRSLELNPDSVEAWFGKGTVLRKLQNLDEAIVAFEKASALKPEDMRIWLSQGNVLMEHQSYDKAIAAYDQALAINPDGIKAYLGKIEALRMMERIEEAIATCDTALNVNRDDPELWYAKAICFAMQANSPSATHALACAIRYDATYQDRACDDPMFFPIRDTPEFRMRVSQTPKAD